MKSFSILLSTLFIVLISFGQQKFDNNSNRVVSLKIAYITDKLELTESEAEKFWPIYKKYETELKNLRINNTTDKNDLLANEEKALQIRKKYQIDFKKAISDNKINKFFIAEKEFNQKVQNEFKKRVSERQDRPRTNEDRKLKHN